MITAKSDSARYKTLFTDGAHEQFADTTADHGGGEAGFRPHDLLEAALASCVNMTVRIYADKRDIPLRSVVTRVELDRGRPDEAVFRYSVELDGDLTQEQRDKLLGAARACPVRRTLLRKIRFESDTDAPGGTRE